MGGRTSMSFHFSVSFLNSSTCPLSTRMISMGACPLLPLSLRSAECTRPDGSSNWWCESWTLANYNWQWLSSELLKCFSIHVAGEPENLEWDFHYRFNRKRFLFNYSSWRSDSSRSIQFKPANDNQVHFSIAWCKVCLSVDAKSVPDKISPKRPWVRRLLLL